MLHVLCLLGTALHSAGSPALTRRSVILAGPAAALASAAFAIGDNKVGYACRGDESCGMSDSATRAFTESSVAGKAGIRFGGSYSDPLHPGCPRKVVLQGGGALITERCGRARGWLLTSLILITAHAAALVTARAVCRVSGSQNHKACGTAA